MQQDWKYRKNKENMEIYWNIWKNIETYLLYWKIWKNIVMKSEILNKLENYENAWKHMRAINPFEGKLNSPVWQRMRPHSNIWILLANDTFLDTESRIVQAINTCLYTYIQNWKYGSASGRNLNCESNSLLLFKWATQTQIWPRRRPNLNCASDLYYC